MLNRKKIDKMKKVVAITIAVLMVVGTLAMAVII